MTLRQRQSEFARKVGILLIMLTEHGYEYTFGDAARIDGAGHKRGSLHYVRLALDINLFLNGKYLRSTDAYRTLGEFWESLGPDCCWGGRFNDGNHISLAYRGRK